MRVYGAPTDSAKLLARIADVERQPPPTETVEGLLNTPFLTLDEVRDYLGGWVGDIWMGANGPRNGRVTLRLRVENGQVIGEIIHRTEMGSDLVNRLEYLKITPRGLTFGFMNGMRPHGVNLFEGARSGDTLSGKKRFGGIKFEEKGPPLQFSFTHQRK